ncbi:MAG: hypothetical protein KAJ19_10390 [Gammaproteobacteria bacterium]|nr:hypothetical protein [Gammaproteobacteria bacterium]
MGEQSPYAEVSQSKFGSQPVMPWHEVVCPRCDGAGEFEVAREVSREMAIDAGDPALEGQPIPDQIQCDLCAGGGKVAAHIARAEEIDRSRSGSA